MAKVTWIGGTHRVTDAGVWIPRPPEANDFASVPAGHVVAINQTLGDYTLSLDGDPTTSTFDSVGSTVTGSLGSFLDAAVQDVPNSGTGHGTAVFLGRSFNDGFLGTSGLYLAYSFPHLDVVIGDVTSPAGIVIQQGVLVNNGVISSGDTNETVTITSPSADALLINNDEIDDQSSMTIDVAVTGTGVINAEAGIRDYNSVLTFGAAVSAGQVVNLINDSIDLADPLNFRGIIEFGGSIFATIKLSATVTSALFQGHYLSLMNGSTLVAQLRFAAPITGDDLMVNSGPNGTVIGELDPDTPIPGNITVTTTDTAPTAPPIVLPPSVTKLPTHGPDVTLASGASVASIDKLDGYTVHLQGASAAAAPSLNESSITFGTAFALRVDGQGAADRYGSLAAVGYNENDGTIAASGGSGGGTASLAFGISDVTSPDGVTILAGAFNNIGTIGAGADATVDITGTADSKLINAGTVVADGMVFIGTTVTGTGAMTVGTPSGAVGNLEIAGEISTGQSIKLQSGTLTVDDAHNFFATIYDFGARDAIVLKGVDVSSVTYNNGALLLDGGADGTLHLHRPSGVAFDTGTFKLTHTGADTIITIPAMT